MQTRHLSFDERKRLHEDRLMRREQERQKTPEPGSRCRFCQRSSPHTHTEHDQHEGLDTDEPGIGVDPHDPGFEEAIKASVAATSRGDPEEDRAIERAIRVSVLELQRRKTTGPVLSEQEALDRAVQASVAEASRNRPNRTDGETRHDEEYDAALEKSIPDSLLLHPQERTVSTGDGGAHEDEEDLRRAIEASKAAHEEHLTKMKTEEDIVLEYIKRQSLLEEEHRNALLETQKGKTTSE